MGGNGGRGEIEIVSASTPSGNEQAKDVDLVHSTAKTNDKSTNLRKSGIIDRAIASVYSEKTRLKKLIMIIIMLMNLSQEMTVFGGCQKLTSTMKEK